MVIWKTPGVSVGTNPIISTDVITFFFPHVDARFFVATEAVEYEPFTFTQVASNACVAEWPLADFETLFGPPQGSPNEFIVSEDPNEQNEYNVMRNMLPTDKAMKRQKCMFVFHPSVRLDFGLIDPMQRQGKVDYEFVGDFDGPNFGIKLRIAVEPEGENGRVLRAEEVNRNRARERFRQFMQRNNAGMNGN